jgi:uncharacterized protein DUF4434
MSSQELPEASRPSRRDFLVSTGAAAAGATLVGHRTAHGAAPAPALPTAEPRISASFFDLTHINIWDAAYWTDTCRFWGEENWRALIRDMHAIGIDTAICVSTALWGRPLFPGYEKTVGKPLKMGCPDPLGACADEADRLGMKMFFGVGLRGRVSQVRDYSNMEPPWPDIWFDWNTALAEALVDCYGDRPCFGGLYMSYEISFRDYQLDLYEKYIKQHIRPAVGDIKLLASPGKLDHADPDLLCKQVERMGVDILAPQDYGGRRSDIAAALELVKNNALGLAAARKPLADMGVTLWSNCELFDFESTPDGRGACIGGPIERIKQQMAIAAPLVEKLTCYQYQGIMNRRTDLVNIGHPSAQRLYNEYVAYLKSDFPDQFKHLSS